MYLGAQLCTFASHREAKAKVQNFGGTMLGFLGTYYEDHIEPVTDLYSQWASNAKSSVWDTIQAAVDDYVPFL